jgi:hypothetical protein
MYKIGRNGKKVIKIYKKKKIKIIKWLFLKIILFYFIQNISLNFNKIFLFIF